MSQAIALLDEALELAQQEKAALEAGSYEEAITFAEKRGKMTEMAWNEYGIEDKVPYWERLTKLSHLQTQLFGMASKAHDNIRENLKNSRQQRRRMQGYHMAVGQALQ